MSFIEPDDSLQKSKLQSNDITNTINRTAELLNTTTENITDSDGNLSLTDSQKTQLNIIFVQNESQISSLIIEKGELESLKSNNISKTNEIKNIKNDNNLGSSLGGTLFSWGAGLIGAGLFLKGFLEPETTGVMLGAIGAVGTGKGGGGGSLVPGCTYNIGDYFIESDGASSTGFYKYTINQNDPNNPDILCSSFSNSSWVVSSGGGTGSYSKGCCTANRVEYTESVTNPQTGMGVGIEPDKERRYYNTFWW